MAARHLPQPRRYFTNSLKDYDGKLTEEEIQDKYKPDLLKEIDNVVGLITSRVRAEPRMEDGGLYVGLSGIAYSLFYVSQSQALSPETRQHCLKFSGTYLEASLEYCGKKSETKKCTGAAFLLGHLGVYAFAAVFYSRTGSQQKSDHYVEKFINLHKMCLPVDFLEIGGDELLVGRAGYLCAALYLQQELGEAVIPGAVIESIVNSIVESGRKTAASLQSPSPLMYSYYNTLYLGAAHGLSSILQMLLSYSGYLGR